MWSSIESHMNASHNIGRSSILCYHIGAAHDEPSPREVGSGLAHRSRTNLKVKVLDFVKSGGPKWTVDRTVFEMWLGAL